MRGIKPHPDKKVVFSEENLKFISCHDFFLIKTIFLYCNPSTGSKEIFLKMRGEGKSAFVP